MEKSQFSCFLDHWRAGSQFCEMQSEMYPTCSDYDCYNIINNIRIDNRLSYCLDGTYLPEQYHIAIECILFVFWEVLILKKPTQIIYQPLSYIARLINLNKTNTDPPDIQLTTMQRLMGEDENNFNDRMMNNKSTVNKDETYLGKNYHIVIGFLSLLLMAYFLMCLQQRYQLLSKIVKIFKSLCHTKADPPNIQNDLHTTQRLMGEDENIFNETEKKTNGMMNENGDGVCMSNCGFNQHNQTPNATTDTPKLCTSGCIIDMPDA